MAWVDDLDWIMLTVSIKEVVVAVVLIPNSKESHG